MSSASPARTAATAPDVTAVLFTIGEPYAERALASVRGQTLVPGETLVIRDVSPFHRALNAAAARVRTELFLHVDADMVLDATCVEDLRACMTDGVGMAIGGLRDPLRGSIVGVKLHRTRCLAAYPWPDSLSPAVDYAGAIARAGWRTAHAVKYRGEDPRLWHTFGEHRPDYTLLYTFMKFRILGARYRHWRNGEGVRRMFSTLQESGHPAATIAQIGAAHGLFWAEKRDALKPYEPSAEVARLERLLHAPAAATSAAVPPSFTPSAAPRQIFLDFHHAGAIIGRTDACSTLLHTMHALACQPGIAPWVALVGLCRGLFAAGDVQPQAEADFELLAPLLPADTNANDV